MVLVEFNCRVMVVFGFLGFGVFVFGFVVLLGIVDELFFIGC